MLEVPTQFVFVHSNVDSRPTGGLLVDVNEGETFRRTGVSLIGFAPSCGWIL